MYIAASNKKAKAMKKDFSIHRDVLVLLEESMPEIDINSVCRRIERSVPKKMFMDLDYIYIGNFDELKIRNVQSAYLRGAIYITNENQTEDSLYAAIIHELAHSIESVFKEIIYGDNEVAAEFVSKRKKLRDLLKAQDIQFEEPSAFLRIEYNPQFDQFLYKTVGYDLLSQLIVGLFVSPYAATSLREYFANGFEHCFNSESQYVKQISPKLYTKISKLTKRAV